MAMKKIRRMTMILVVLLICAIVLGWGMAWKVIVGLAAVIDLILIAMKLINK